MKTVLIYQKQGYPNRYVMRWLRENLDYNAKFTVFVLLLSMTNCQKWLQLTLSTLYRSSLNSKFLKLIFVYKCTSPGKVKYVKADTLWQSEEKQLIKTVENADVLYGQHPWPIFKHKICIFNCEPFFYNFPSIHTRYCTIFHNAEIVWRRYVYRNLIHILTLLSYSGYTKFFLLPFFIPILVTLSKSTL